MIVVLAAGTALGAFLAWRFGLAARIARLWAAFLKFAGWCLGITVALAVGWSMFGIGGLMLVGLGVLAAWIASLFLKEWSDCPACGGGSRHRGVYARQSFSLCGRCAGTSGRVVRLGLRIWRPSRARALLDAAGAGDRPLWRG